MQFDGRGSQILVVDNDRTTLEMVQIRLDVAGYHSIPARSALTALELLETTRPAAMIVERNLIGIDGMDLLRMLHGMPARKTPPVLLMGRALAADDIRAGVELGVRDCLAKPFSGAAMLERLGRMLSKSAHAPTAQRACATA